MEALFATFLVFSFSLILCGWSGWGQPPVACCATAAATATAAVLASDSEDSEDEHQRRRRRRQEDEDADADAAFLILQQGGEA
ncbi:hypothetical protein V8C86DRAFT_2663933 [Haematococcus lacustris]